MRNEHQDPPTTLLIVDDDSFIRGFLSEVLAEIKFSVRSAPDGFSALAEIRKEIPGILLSDINMPGMSGFELLSVVRRRFPAILVIAMSGSFSGKEVPSGVPADAFYQKGSSLGALLQIIRTLHKDNLAFSKLPAQPRHSGFSGTEVTPPGWSTS
jgi:DNA-binding NtrC family response regulator